MTCLNEYDNSRGKKCADLALEPDDYCSHCYRQAELYELRKQLTAVGFSKRAIATACKNIERMEN